MLPGGMPPRRMLSGSLSPRPMLKVRLRRGWPAPAPARLLAVPVAEGAPVPPGLGAAAALARFTGAAGQVLVLPGPAGQVLLVGLGPTPAGPPAQERAGGEAAAAAIAAGVVRLVQIGRAHV